MKSHRVIRSLARLSIASLLAASMLFAGAGVKKGFVLGKTDKQGGTVTQRPVAPADVCFTILDALGVNPRKELRTPDGRPIEALDLGESVKELFV